MSRSFSFLRLPGFHPPLGATVGYAARFVLTSGSEVFVMAPSLSSLRKTCDGFGLQLDLLGAEKVVMTSADILERR